MRGRDKEAEPVEWTGPVARPKRPSAARPARRTVRTGTSVRKQAEVRQTQIAEKSRSPDALLPVPHTDTGRPGDFPPGGRAHLCQGTRQLDPVPSEEGVPW